MHFLLSAKCSCFLSQRPKTPPCPSGGTCLFTSGTEITPDPCRHSPPAQRQRIHLQTAEQGAGELHKGVPGGLAHQEATGQPPTGCSRGSPQPPPWHPPPPSPQPRTFPRRHSISQSAAANQSCACATQSQRCSQEEAEARGGCGGKVGLAVSPPAAAPARCVCVGGAGSSPCPAFPGSRRFPCGREGGRKTLMLPSQCRLEEHGLPLPSWLPAVGRAEGWKPAWAPHSKVGPEWICRCWEPPETPTRYLPKPVCLFRAGGVSSRTHPGIPSGTCCVWWPSAESGTSLRWQLVVLLCRDLRHRASFRRKLQLGLATWDSPQPETKSGLPLVGRSPRARWLCGSPPG